MRETARFGAKVVEEEALVFRNGRRKSTVREYVQAILIAVVLCLIIRTFVSQAFKIPTGSMIPTLLVGDYILVNKFIYGVNIPFTNNTLVEVSTPKRGDVVVFKYPLDPSKDYIKRIIGLPGDRIELTNRHLLLNGQAALDSHAFYSTSETALASISKSFGPITVPPDHLFVMGDNRNASSDSRVWGFVPASHVEGKAFLVYWSFDQSRSSVRWERLGSFIH